MRYSAFFFRVVTKRVTAGQFNDEGCGLLAKKLVVGAVPVRGTWLLLHPCLVHVHVSAVRGGRSAAGIGGEMGVRQEFKEFLMVMDSKFGGWLEQDNKQSAVGRRTVGAR
jgi:hypothetical protein